MRLSDYPVVFTSDSSYFFACHAKSIRIFSVETGQIVRVLSSSSQEGGHTDTVTAIMLNPKNTLQLYSASLDGTIKLWDFNDAVLLRTIEVGVPITNMVMSASTPDDVYITTKKKSTKRFHQGKQAGAQRAKENIILLRCSLKGARRRLIRLLKAKVCTGLAISSDGEYIVMAERYRLHVIHIGAGDGIEAGNVTENDESRFRCYIAPERISTVAFHPTEGCIATGDDVGRITLWYCFGKNVDRPVTSTMHWHAHKVTALCFNADGSYLLSGGEEAVMVIWQMGSGRRQFVPRLGSEIKHITVSPDQTMYAIGHMDNSLNIIRSVDLKLKTAIQGLKYSEVTSKHNPLSTGLVIEPRNGNVVLNGLPGTIQFFDPIHEQHIMEQEITPRNRVTRVFEKDIIPPRVLHVAFSNEKEARWMVTVDGRDDHETTPEQYLKFWEYDDDARTYVLNTRVDSPHTKTITSCIFNPRQGGQAPMVVTTSLDGKFKVWELSDQGQARRGIEAERAWRCRSTGFYRNMPAYCGGFSSDGSLLAIAYGQIITLWNPYLNTLQGVLTQPPENEPVTRLTFLKNSPFLIAATKEHLYSWNLLTCSVWWSYQIRIGALVASPTHAHFMVTCLDPTKVQGAPERRIVVFRPTSPTPVKIETTARKVRGLTFMPEQSKAGTTTPLTKEAPVEPILIMNHAFDFEILGGRTPEELKAEAEEMALANAKAAEEAAKSKGLVSGIFGSSSDKAAEKQKKKKNEAAVLSQRTTLSKKNLVQNPLFDAPSHVMAPVSSLYEAFMGQLLAQTKGAKEEAKAARAEAKKEQEKEEEEEKEAAEAKENTDVNMQEDTTVEQTTFTDLPSSLSSFFTSRLTL
ncbi:hypothetical protein BGZ94_009944 [Podila epigama]|nr:hypothetical protein BGZ94_009944 [Podila epigama]